MVCHLQGYTWGNTKREEELFSNGDLDLLKSSLQCTDRENLRAESTVFIARLTFFLDPVICNVKDFFLHES